MPVAAGELRSVMVPLASMVYWLKLPLPALAAS
jgi:hypothetical protein